MSFKDARHGDALSVVEVRRTERISPNFVRVTLGGEQFAEMPDHGFDHWFRLYLPRESGETNFDLPHHLDMLGYLKYLRMDRATRPPMRNYTSRDFRKHALEMDVDFVVHGDEGLATRWATRAKAGDRVALLDQGTGFDHDPAATHVLLVTDETGLPAVAGILRDLPGDKLGTAIIEVPHAEDVQELDAPSGVDVQWLVRDDPHGKPGELALDAVRGWTKPDGTLQAYCVGEQALATGARRHLVNELHVPKSAVAFVGYWRMGKGAA
jgi:NADPH-dependent ferric siderophore reductase